MKIQIIVYDKILIEHCNLRLWSIHNGYRDKRGRMYVTNKTDVRKKILVLDGEYKIIEE